ncbi:MAG: hypothetical protein DKM50_10875 [Candidatus Margulisiibacteriota bacterium]|nr:MAG: hypothetical protein A2X43_07685 [Candidatus Margulisbacteria bacterium GWD2_39_127]OGI03896.1 MAG: hypothetical protein A2X42_10050 [Candidatus Margulisbacteria bacterium GWF2_38_17]OGI08799.1 MAG: hypothetical protein A2X41_05065 [Candidatus Margulisbacteria bacterium GWE2_39_32]PZM78630.1 MAG: hypothetical protein DKM50_10875 [Candidatus Margulisiibacteriota bacterium]HAR61971.1 hypothetical protein [Candidatus Margulisiibacteriota bacterium]
MTDNKPYFSIKNLFDGPQLRTTFEALLLERYPRLQELKNSELVRNNYTRYEHTKKTLLSYHQLVQNDYKNFNHLDELAVEKGAHPITIDQFTTLRELTLEYTQTLRDEHYLFLILLTHDYGTIYGNSRHFIKSGEICRNDFINDGYSDYETRLAQIINSNHSYLGDLFLGEASVNYGLDLITEIEHDNYPAKRFWDLLIILTTIDIHSTKDGFLGKEKINALFSVNDRTKLGQLKNIWQRERFRHLIGQPDFYQRHQNTLPPAVEKIYFQYFWYIAQELSAPELVEIFSIAGNLLELSNKGFLETFKYITFSGDGMKEITRIKEMLTARTEIILINKLTGKVGNTNFSISNDGYLEFYLG